MDDEPRILWLVAKQDGQPVGPVLWRVWFPMGQLQRRGFTAEFDYQPVSDLALTLVTAAVNAYRINALVLPRVYWPRPADGRELVDACHAAGLCVLGEYDDDMFLHLDEVKRNDPSLSEVELYREQRVAALRMMDGAIVSTPALATVVRSLTDKPVAVCPNRIDLDWWHRASQGGKRLPALVGKTTIGWAGGKRPVEDLLPMLTAWGRIARRFPSAHFVVVGWCPDEARAFVPKGRLHHIAWLPLERYPQAYANIDIGCCAVETNLFNRCKSPIKAYEYAASGAAVVATPWLYRDVVAHGETGWLAETADEWERALAMLLVSPSGRRQMARRLLRKVERDHSYNDDESVYRWLDGVAMIRRHFVLTQGAAA
jgi:glycosyltransferase involved in cell wall biosynthesis